MIRCPMNDKDYMIRDLELAIIVLEREVAEPMDGFGADGIQAGVEYAISILSTALDRVRK